MVGVFESAIGASPALVVRSGAMPANCAATATGSVLVTINLAADWMSAPSGGSVQMNGTPEDTSADGTGLAGYYRINQGATCHEQGLVAETWLGSKAYLAGQQVSNDSGRCYRCITAGTSAASGGPTGTGANIADNTAAWQYVGLVDMTIANTSINAGQPVTITQWQVTAPGA
jgi:hypothetical protein